MHYTLLTVGFKIGEVAAPPFSKVVPNLSVCRSRKGMVRVDYSITCQMHLLLMVLRLSISSMLPKGRELMTLASVTWQ